MCDDQVKRASITSRSNWYTHVNSPSLANANNEDKPPALSNATPLHSSLEAHLPHSSQTSNLHLLHVVRRHTPHHAIPFNIRPAIARLHIYQHEPIALGHAVFGF
jgi:hypothetical protein